MLPLLGPHRKYRPARAGSTLPSKIDTNVFFASAERLDSGAKQCQKGKAMRFSFFSPQNIKKLSSLRQKEENFGTRTHTYSKFLLCIKI
jgi:hypothetical protein